MIITKKQWRVIGSYLVSFLAVHTLLFAQGWQSLGDDEKRAPSPPTEMPRQRQNNYGIVDNQVDRQQQNRTETSDQSDDTDTRLAKMAKKYESAVGLVVRIVPQQDGKFEPEPFGTAWALRHDTFATNSHITESVIKLLKHGYDVFVALNKNPGKRYRVVHASSHPRYREVKTNFDGVKSVDLTYDVGLLKIDGSVEVTFPVASQDELQKLDAGYRVAYLGFPMENLINGNVDVRNPIATMQSGIITAISDYWQGNGGFKNNVLIRHNLGATGGASGSPLFNTNGEVVGILNAGNIIMQVKGMVRNEKGLALVTQRAPSAAMVNFGQRVDLIDQIR
jgi:Trypsin-like peptidase domain